MWMTVAGFIFSHVRCWVGHNVSLSSICTDHRVSSWHVHVTNLVTRHPDFELKPPCSTTGRLPLISFLIYQWPFNTYHWCKGRPKPRSLLWYGNNSNSSPTPLPITPGSSTWTSDIDCNCLPCAGAPLSYSWFDFNLNLKVWSQTGQESV